MSSTNTSSLMFGALSRDFFYADSLIDKLLSEDEGAVRRLLLVKRANPNTVVPDRGVAPIHILVGLENEEFSVPVALMAFAKCGADPNVPSEDGLTPVHVAAMWGRCKMLEVLLSNGGDPYLIVYELQLTAEEYALKERQWRAYGVLAANSVVAEDPEAKCLEHHGSGRSEKEVEDTTDRTEDGCRNLEEEDSNWTSSFPEGLLIDEKTKRIITKHRQGTRVYEYPKEVEESSLEEDQETYSTITKDRRDSHLSSRYQEDREEIPLNCGQKDPKRHWSSKRLKQKSEAFFCSFSESSFGSRTSARSVMNSSKMAMLRSDDKRIICKVSRILSSMLKKQNEE